MRRIDDLALIRSTIVEEPWVWVAGLGLFLATLDTGIINIALPTLQNAWHATAAAAAWTVIAYTLALAGTVLFWGRLADHIGADRLFGLGLGLFALASAACGAAPSLAWLVGARAAQGLGSAMIQGTAAALITTRLPEAARTRAIGTLALFQGLGPVIGPTVGGLLLAGFTWRSLFWVNLPVTVPLGMWAMRHGSAIRRRSADIRALDAVGQALLLTMVVAALLALTEHGAARDFWLALMLRSGGTLVWWERRAPTPLMPHNLTAPLAFWSAVAAMLIVGGATSLGFMVPPYMLQQSRSLRPWQIGLINMSAPAMLVLFSRRASRLIGPLPPLLLMTTGLGLMAGAFVLLAIIVRDPAITMTVASLGIYGIGAALFFPSNLAGLLSSVGSEAHGRVGALQRLSINLGTAVDVAIVGTTLAWGKASAHAVTTVGIRLSWLWGAGTLILAGLLTSFVAMYSRSHQV